MLYMGHFSFESREPANTPGDVEGGSFTCLVEAESVDSAAEKFGDLIITTFSDSPDAFESVGNVFVDAIIEVKKLPDEGVVTYFEERSNNGLGARIVATLPGVSQEYCAAYGLEQEIESDEDRQYAEPFITLREEE